MLIGGMNMFINDDYYVFLDFIEGRCLCDDEPWDDEEDWLDDSEIDAPWPVNEDDGEYPYD